MQKYLNFFKWRTVHHGTDGVLSDARRFMDMQLEQSRQHKQFWGYVWRKLRPSQRSYVHRFERELLKAMWWKLAQLLSIHLNLGACYSDTFVGLCTVALALVIMFFSVSVIQEGIWQIINSILLFDSQLLFTVDRGRYLMIDQSEDLILLIFVFWLADKTVQFFWLNIF